MYAAGQFSIINWVRNINWLLALCHLLWQRANDQNVSFETCNGGQFTLSIQLIILNYLVILAHLCSTTVSLESYPLYSFVYAATNFSFTGLAEVEEGEVKGHEIHLVSHSVGRASFGADPKVQKVNQVKRSKTYCWW